MPRNECKAVLNIAGEAYQCDMLTHMKPGTKHHDGWAHSNKEAHAIWLGHQENVDMEARRGD